MSTIVAAVAALISLCVIVFFLVMAWRRLKMSNQCRNALEKSGLVPCFHQSKELANGGGNEEDKGGNNRGNFYTVTPKMNGAAASGNSNGGSNGANNEENSEVVEHQQFFEHMIQLQKNNPAPKRNSKAMRWLIAISASAQAKPSRSTTKPLASAPPSMPRRMAMEMPASAGVT